LRGWSHGETRFNAVPEGVARSGSAARAGERKEHERRDGGIREVAQQLGVHVESVRNWVRQASIDRGDAPGMSGEDKARIRQLERDNAELRRANEILKSAAAFFGAELDRRHTR
jgi:transposase